MPSALFAVVADSRRNRDKIIELRKAGVAVLAYTCTTVTLLAAPRRRRYSVLERTERRSQLVSTSIALLMGSPSAAARLETKES